MSELSEIEGVDPKVEAVLIEAASIESENFGGQTVVSDGVSPDQAVEPEALSAPLEQEPVIVEVAPVAPAPPVVVIEVAPTVPDRASPAAVAGDSMAAIYARLNRLSDRDEQSRRRLRLAEALEEVANFTVWSGAAGFLPIPLLDLVTVTTVQALMLRKLAKIYGASLDKDLARATIGVLGSALFSTGAGTTVASSLSKVVPFWADYIGSTVTSCVAGAMTFAMGRAFIVHFESGGTALRFDANAIRDEFMKIFKAESARRKAAAG